MDYATVKSLNDLFEKRGNIRRAKGYCSTPTFWGNLLGKVGDGTGTHSSVVSALGGREAFAEAVGEAMTRKFEAMENALDEQIIDLGGKP